MPFVLIENTNRGINGKKYLPCTPSITIDVGWRYVTAIEININKKLASERSLIQILAPLLKKIFSSSDLIKAISKKIR